MHVWFYKIWIHFFNHILPVNHKILKIIVHLSRIIQCLRCIIVPNIPISISILYIHRRRRRRTTKRKLKILVKSRFAISSIFNLILFLNLYHINDDDDFYIYFEYDILFYWNRLFLSKIYAINFIIKFIFIYIF